ncbi:MAG: hypothetical protein ACE5IJ_10805 [Thermoplasmata archaeon]
MGGRFAYALGQEWERMSFVCDLCRLISHGDAETKRHHPPMDESVEDLACVVVDCPSCSAPLVVFSFHGRDPTKDEKLYARSVIHELFPGAIIETTQRTVEDHPHWHIVGPVERRQ